MYSATLIILAATLIIFWGAAIFDISRHEFKEGGSKMLWFLLVLFFPIVGTIVYFLTRNKLLKEKPRPFGTGYVQ